MTSYKKMNKAASIQGFNSKYKSNIELSKMFTRRQKFPHVKYVKQLLDDHSKGAY